MCASKPQSNMVVMFAYMELTSSWPRKSSTPILQRHVAPSGINILLQYESFSTKMQTKHISNICKNYLKTIEDEGVLTVVDFPPQSPDLNPRWGWRPEKAKYSAISQEALQGTVINWVIRFYINLSAQVLSPAESGTWQIYILMFMPHWH